MATQEKNIQNFFFPSLSMEATQAQPDPPDKGGETSRAGNIMIVSGGSSVAPPGTIVRVGGSATRGSRR
ncbi:hypothetical protein FVEG_16997 [Fusarium verticillioides 7600]|uniref:Uncharacterized protein n=1 Tax=Gibberella moniliformis (strain M3125 / FGSC 7600) TaxID=334819 RepID=W7MND1_GIBM7|nr:hypothetical protein FVEG_16997 [Fusarium verticillioides 7600]EWG52581.1 hypothetical protein FVEG_16997 [Fusarium verticillioides 7600]